MKPLPGQGEPLTVVMRVRPMNSKEFKSDAKCIVFPVDDKFVVLRDPNEDTDDILRANRSREKKYIFDHVFSSEASQTDVYETLVEEKNIIDTVLSGYNCTVFAYGATGTGKTHTMLGSDENPGIMVHTLNSLFRRMEETSKDKVYTVSIGYLEIYNENVRDLLCPDSGSLELREDANGSIVISNLLDISAESTEVVLGMLRMGNTNRTCEPTVANATSSRSHAILKVNVECRSKVSNIMQESHCGSLYMVDLAGSERAAVTQNRGKRLIEGAHINRSLLALANCINALGSNASNYVNYRDSKLTRILKEALGGNCKTVMIAHVSPASTSYEETRNTMLYAERTKKIKNKARQNIVDVNHHVTQYINIIGDLNLQIARLKRELNRAELGAAIPESEEVTSLCERLKALVTDQKILRQQVLDVEVTLVQTAIKCRQRHSCIQEWEQKREEFNLATLTAPSSTAPSPSPTLGADSAIVNTGADPLLSQYADVSVSSNPATSSYHPIPTDDMNEFSMLSPAKSPSDQDLHTTPEHAEANPALLEENTATHVTECTHMEKTRGALPVGTSDASKVALTSKNSSKPDICPLVKPRHILPGGQLLVPLSPEPDGEFSLAVTSSTDQVIEADGGRDGRVNEEITAEEPAEIQVAREELITLETKKEKKEKHHRILKKKLQLTRESINETKEELACVDNFLPTRKEIVDLLLSNSDIERSSMQQSLSAALLRAHLQQQSALMQQLLQHSATLLSLLERQKGQEDRSGRLGNSSLMVKDWDLTLSEASEKQRRLIAQVAELSAVKSYGGFSTETPGFKSNMNEEFQEMGSASAIIPVDTNCIHLPSIVQPNHSECGNNFSTESSSFCCQLPPVSAKAADASTAAKTAPIEKKLQPSSNQSSSPLKKSEIDQIVEEAKRNRDKRNAINPGERTKRTSKQLQERTLIPCRKMNRTYRVIKTQKVATTRSLVIGQQAPATSEVIDLECTDATAATTETKGQLLQTDFTDSLLQSRNTQSHSNLSAVQGPALKSNLTNMEDAEKSKRKVQARVGSVTSSKSVPGTIGARKKKGTQELGRSKAVIVAQEPQINDKWARKTRYWGAASKPLVKKIAFSSQLEISPHPLNSSSGVGDSDTNSVSDKGLATEDSSTDTSQHLKRKQRPSLPNHQPWRNRRRHGAPPHNTQPTKSRYPLHSCKQLSMSKVVAGSQFSNIESSPYQNAFPNARTVAGSQINNTPSRKPLLIRRRFPGDFNKT